jgi:glycosyltransferase involved in cell wall biosynthesis
MGAPRSLVPPGDADAMAVAIQRLHEDRELAAALAATALDAVRRMLAPRTRRNLFDAYASVLGHAVRGAKSR